MLTLAFTIFLGVFIIPIIVGIGIGLLPYALLALFLYYCLITPPLGLVILITLAIVWMFNTKESLFTWDEHQSF